MPSEAPILQVESISKRFDGVLAANNVSFNVHDKEIVGLDRVLLRRGMDGAGEGCCYSGRALREAA